MYSIKDVCDDEFVKMDASRKVVRHKRINILLLLTVIIGSYFAFGYYSELLE